MEELEYLNKSLHELIDDFKRESEKHKQLYRNLRYFVFSSTACATVLSSLALTFKEAQLWLNIGVVLTSVAASVVTAVEGLRKPSELWVLERNTFHALRDLKRELDFNATAKPDALDVQHYFSRMQSILDSSTEKWTRELQPPQKNT